MEKAYLTTNERKAELKKFQKEWPISRIRKMKLEDYIDIGNDKTFCYWVEIETGSLGSIRGIPADKFGIYKRGKKKHPNSKLFYSDSMYSWRRKFNKPRDHAFSLIRSRIVEVATLAQKAELEKIEKIDLHEFFKWKIAYLYSNDSICPFFSTHLLRSVAKHLKMKNYKSANHAELHLYISKNRPSSKTLNDFSVEMWQKYSKKNVKKILNNDPSLEDFDPPTGTEGNEVLKRGKDHLARERDSKFRNKYRKFKRHVAECPVCKLNASKKYKLKNPNSFLEMHHIEPLKHRTKSKVTTVDDVELLCPSCHRAIHRMMSEKKEKIITIKVFKQRIKK